MYVHSENEQLVELFDDDLVPPEGDPAAYRLEFTDNHLAQCKDQVGEAYIDNYGEIEPHDPSDDDLSEEPDL
jgi:hypothetical protein